MLAGDYNVIPSTLDAEFPEKWVEDALFQFETREKFRELISLGLTDALRAVNDEKRPLHLLGLSGWCLPKNNGIRIDHLLLSPKAVDRLHSVGIDKKVRAADKPSDHVPIFADLRFAEHQAGSRETRIR